MAETVTVSREEYEEFKKAKEKQEKWLIAGRKFVIEQSLYVLKAKDVGIKVTQEEIQRVYDRKFGKGK